MGFKKPRKLLNDAVKYDLMVDLARMLLGSHTRISTTNEKSVFSVFNRDRINVIPKTNEVYVYGPLHLHSVERLVTLYAFHFEEQFLVHNFYKSKGSFIPDSYIVKLR